MKNILFVCFLALAFSGSAQSYKPFSGRLVYRIEFQSSLDSAAVPQSKTIVYTNDTLVRVESETSQFGGQVLIKHLLLQKYYLLLEYEDQKFAIQQHMPPDTAASKYTFKRKLFGRKKFSGIKARRVMVNAAGFERPVEMWYFPSISPKYLDVLKGVKGLPVDYYLRMEDGYLHYILESIEPSPVNMDLFGIPSDFRKVSFDEFMDQMMKGQEEH